MTGSGDAELPTAAAEPRTGRLPPWLRISLQLFGLTGFAFAQPLFSLLGENPTFFVAHGAGRAEVIWFTVLVVLVPAAVLTSLVLLLRAISSTAGDIAMTIAVGLLFTLALVSNVEAFDDASLIVFLLTLVLGAGIAGFVYRRFSGVRAFVTVLGLAPVLFVLFFLFTSPVSALIVEDDPAPSSAAAASDAPVVFLLFDELPLGGLLDSRGSIDAQRFPNFARLAGTSTWYRNATTVSPWTHLAVPAILTGALPDPEKPPVAGQYQRSLFTLLGGSYRFEVTEQITSLCPKSLCAGRASEARPETLAKDGGIVMLHQLLPAGIADDWLPTIGGQWADFGDGGHGGFPTDDAELGMSEWQAEIAREEHESDFGQFLGSISGDRTRALWYHHEMNPHMPYRYLPDGTMYEGRISGSLDAAWTDWVADPMATVNARQRFMLQLRYADRQVGELLDALEEQSLMRDALVVVVSDHGISFKAGGQRRGVTELTPDGDRVPLTAAEMAGGSADEVMPVPLFVKYPKQAAGVVDDRRAQTIDVLPTLVDALRISLPADWAFDGRSLLADPRTDPPRDWLSGTTPPETYDYRPDPKQMARDLRELMGPGGGPHDLYAVGPAGGLVGQDVDGRIGGADRGSIRRGDPAQFEDIEPSAPVQPALFWALVDDIETGSWLAVALNGIVAGVGPVFIDRDGNSMLEAMLDPSLMKRGRNEVQVFVISEDGATLHPITG